MGETVEFEVWRVSRMMESAYPRIIWQSYLISLWSFFESSIKSIADTLLKEHWVDKDGFGLSISTDDFAGGLLKNLKMVFEEKLLFRIPLDWKKLKLIYEVRNIIVHQNGALSGLNGEKLKYLKKNFTPCTGLEFSVKQNFWIGDQFQIEDEFCRWALDVIRTELNKAVKALRDT